MANRAVIFEMIDGVVYRYGPVEETNGIPVKVECLSVERENATGVLVRDQVALLPPCTVEEYKALLSLASKAKLTISEPRTKSMCSGESTPSTPTSDAGSQASSPVASTDGEPDATPTAASEASSFKRAKRRAVPPLAMEKVKASQGWMYFW